MRTIKIEKLNNYRGGPLMVPTLDEMGSLVREPILGSDGQKLKDTAGNPITQSVEVHGTIVDVLGLAVLDFPREKLTMKHISEANKLLGVLAANKDTGSPELHIEDANYDWLVSVLKENEIGVRMFGLNLVSVLAALGADI